MATQAEQIVKSAICELSRRSLWQFCQALSPGFYKDDRPHLKKLCDTLQKLYEGELIHNGKVYKKLQTTLPPQHGKSRTLTNFSAWCLGKDNEERILLASYNDETAQDFSAYTRNTIAEISEEGEIVFRDIFPDTKLKYGETSKKKWALHGQHFNYKGGGLIGGGFTGKGGTIRIVDDPIKGINEAMNEDHLQKLWNSFTGTFMSRVSSKDSVEDEEHHEGIDIVNHTRWAKQDIIGRLNQDKKTDLEKPIDWINENEGVCGDWYLLTFKVIDSEGEMLCPGMLSRSKYEEIKAEQPEEIHNANYLQETIDAKGRMFHPKLYDPAYIDSELVKHFDVDQESAIDSIIGYVDVAEDGADDLSFPLGVIIGDQCFIHWIIYTTEGVEITLPLCIDLINEIKPDYVRVESNAAGAMYARDIKKNKTAKTHILKVRSKANKHTRIYTNSKSMNEQFLFRDDYKSNEQYAKFMKCYNTYMKEKGSSKHDDAPDSAAGLMKFLKNLYAHKF